MIRLRVYNLNTTLEITYEIIVRHCYRWTDEPTVLGTLLKFLLLFWFIGRVLFGFTSDHPIVRRRRLFVYNGALTVCGVATVLSIYATTYYTMMVYSAVFGVTIGSSILHSFWHLFICF